MNNFEKWWATIEPGFAEVQPVLMLSYKEIADKAYEAGREAGYDRGYEQGTWDGWETCG